MINESKINRAIEYLRRPTYKNAKKIIDILVEEGEPVDVTTISRKLGVYQPECSQALIHLKSAGLVKTEKRGRHRFYSVNYDELEIFMRNIDALATYADALEDTYYKRHKF